MEFLHSEKWQCARAWRGGMLVALLFCGDACGCAADVPGVDVGSSVEGTALSGEESLSEFEQNVEALFEDRVAINEYYCECDKPECREDVEMEDARRVAACMREQLDTLSSVDGEKVFECFAATASGWKQCVEELEECEPDVLDEDDPRPCSEQWSEIDGCEVLEKWTEEMDSEMQECVESERV